MEGSPSILDMLMDRKQETAPYPTFSMHSASLIPKKSLYGAISDRELYGSVSEQESAGAPSKFHTLQGAPGAVCEEVPSGGWDARCRPGKVLRRTQ